jgi:hypothetical protein
MCPIGEKIHFIFIKCSYFKLKELKDLEIKICCKKYGRNISAERK